MNIFKGLLFLEGHLTASALTEDDFGPSYGNKIASERNFSDAFSQPEFARNAKLAEACTSGGCG